MSIPEKHHYVWRHYLAPWAQEKRIWTLLKQKGRVEFLGLTDVVQERFFYRLVDLNNEEENSIRKFIEASCHPSIKGLNLDFLALFTSTRKLKDSLQTSAVQNKPAFEKEIRDLEVRLMEDAHGRMEGLGQNLVNVRSFEDLKNLDSDDNYLDAIMFLCIQYFRTNKAKKNALRSFQRNPLESFIKKTWNIFAYILATILARNISFDQRLRFTFCVNNTGISFITSDQPILNLLGGELDDNGDVRDLEFFYPLSPKAAIKIYFRSAQVDRYSEEILDLARVQELNNTMYDNADFFVFGESREQLEGFKNDNSTTV